MGMSVVRQYYVENTVRAKGAIPPVGCVCSHETANHGTAGHGHT